MRILEMERRNRSVDPVLIHEAGPASDHLHNRHRRRLSANRCRQAASKYCTDHDEPNRHSASFVSSSCFPCAPSSAKNTDQVGMLSILPTLTGYPPEAASWATELMALPVGDAPFEYWMRRHPDGRRWMGIKAGTYLVDRAIQASEKSVVDLVSTPTDEIIRMAQETPP